MTAGQEGERAQKRGVSISLEPNRPDPRQPITNTEAVTPVAITKKITPQKYDTRNNVGR